MTPLQVAAPALQKAANSSPSVLGMARRFSPVCKDSSGRTSTPGPAPTNTIRVVSNSWGSDGDYDPNGAIATLTDKLTFEHGVAVIFAASNSGGSGAECSGDLRTNVYANTLCHFCRCPDP